MTDKLPPLELAVIGRPPLILPKIDLEKDKEQREKERFEMLCRAFDDVPREPVLCRCYVELKDDGEEK